MNQEDFDLKLLAGEGIKIEGLGITYPLSLKEIMTVGNLAYNYYVFTLLVEKPTTDTKLTVFELFLAYCYHNEELLPPLNLSFREMAIRALSLIFKEPVFYHPQGFFYLGELIQKDGIFFGRILTENQFDLIRKIIRKQNYFKEEKNEDIKYANEKARQIQEKINAMKEKIRQQNKDEGLKLNDIISIVASYSPNINMFNVWDLTIFQLYELYIRLMMKDTYESQFAMLLQGADPKELKLEHWARKTNLESQ